MRIRISAGAALLALALLATPGLASVPDFSTRASGSWRYVPVLSSAYGVSAGLPALVLEQASIPFAVRRLGDEDSEDDDFLEATTPYVIVAAGLVGTAYLAGQVFGGDDADGAQPLPNGPSTNTPGAPIGPGGPIIGPTGSPTAPLPPETTVPEPITMTLLATGLAGIGGARLRRRRLGDA